MIIWLCARHRRQSAQQPSALMAVRIVSPFHYYEQVQVLSHFYKVSLAPIQMCRGLALAQAIELSLNSRQHLLAPYLPLLC